MSRDEIPLSNFEEILANNLVSDPSRSDDEDAINHLCDTTSTHRLKTDEMGLYGIMPEHRDLNLVVVSPERQAQFKHFCTISPSIISSTFLSTGIDTADYSTSITGTKTQPQRSTVTYVDEQPKPVATCTYRLKNFESSVVANYRDTFKPVVNKTASFDDNLEVEASNKDPKQNIYRPFDDYH